MQLVWYEAAEDLKDPSLGGLWPMILPCQVDSAAIMITDYSQQVSLGHIRIGGPERELFMDLVEKGSFLYCAITADFLDLLYAKVGWDLRERRWKQTLAVLGFEHVRKVSGAITFLFSAENPVSVVFIELLAETLSPQKRP